MIPVKVEKISKPFSQELGLATRLSPQQCMMLVCFSATSASYRATANDCDVHQ